MLLDWLLRRIARRKKISDSEEEQNEFNCGSDGIVLVAGLDVPDHDSRAGDLLDVVEHDCSIVQREILRVVQIHYG